MQDVNIQINMRFIGNLYYRNFSVNLIPSLRKIMQDKAEIK